MNKQELIDKIKEHKKKITIVLIALLFIGGVTSTIYLTANSDNDNKDNISAKNDDKTSEKNSDKKIDNEVTSDIKNDEKTVDESLSLDNEDIKKDTPTSTNNSNNIINNSVETPITPPTEEPVTPPIETPVTPPSSGGNQAPSTTSHTHSWVAVNKTIDHPEQGHYETVVVKESWIENKPIMEWKMRVLCNVCQQDITEELVASGGESYPFHVKQFHPSSAGGYHDEQRQVQTGSETINHPAVTEQRYVVDKPAWSEQVLDHYRCSCGATK